ncbi:PepSY domain-containing protein [Phenylobacterium sp.]|uniref:PepSY-associated TM helix domain-containing protein n=1 Tax=Phenylobacterium sp. TaxID=1871053 RepID=UPI002F4160A8
MAVLDISPASSLYRAVWRWHFIAGLIVLPVLVMMAITGGLYLFKPELDHLAYRRFEDVPARAAALAAPSAVTAKVEAATGGRVLQFTPAEAGQSVRLLVRAPDGRALTAFADPYDGHLLGATAYGGIMQLVRKIHSLQKFGFWASTIIEVAAGWAIVMVGTGVFLWWPRGRDGGVVTVRGAPRQRVFWRDLHAVTGTFAATVILFLAVTGMPWSMFWGDHVQKWVTAANLYEPAPPAKVTPGWMLSMDMPAVPVAQVKPDRPWALQQAPMPKSMDMPGMDTTGASMTGARDNIGLDIAIQRFERAGLKHPYNVTLPDGPTGAYAADYRPDRVEDSRTVYLDQYSGRVLGDVGFAQWGPAAKAIEWGVAVHQGQEYGPANRYLMLAGCITIVLLAVSAVVMWWKRRPRGQLGVPPAPGDRRVAWAVLGVVAVVGVIYPLVGASLLAALVADRLMFRRGTSAAT